MTVECIGLYFSSDKFHKHIIPFQWKVYFLTACCTLFYTVFVTVSRQSAHIIASTLLVFVSTIYLSHSVRRISPALYTFHKPYSSSISFMTFFHRNTNTRNKYAITGLTTHWNNKCHLSWAERPLCRTFFRCV